MYKIGDRVKVKEDLVNDTYYSDLWFDKEMGKFKGLSGTIEEFRYGEYNVRFDNVKWNNWVFNDDMLEPVDKVDDTTKCKGIAQFHKVSFEQFKKDFMETLGFDEQVTQYVYDNIKLPKRATVDSAGHDFFAPITFTLKPNETIKIPTGIRVEIDKGWTLLGFPRSGLGFKYRLQIDNTIPVIDGDYYYSDNEGHIFVKITNCTNEGKILTVKIGEGFMQGIFVQYGITVDDDATGIRNGGFGSTSK